MNHQDTMSTKITRKPTFLLRDLCGLRVFALIPGVFVVGCASAPPLSRQQCDNPDVKLAAVVRPLEEQRAKGCEPLVPNGPGSCDELRRDLERLLMVCPGHAPTLMANAVLAYDDRRPAKAQQLLDQLLSQTPSDPDAAVLRARIAIEDGNMPFARRLLAQQIRFTPDHAVLHETFGATLYLAREWAEARRELVTAGALGAPAWRIAYHLGLVEEGSGRPEEARRYYAEALEGNPAWAPAESHLKALRARDAGR